jgi:kynurenine formamidase
MRSIEVRHPVEGGRKTYPGLPGPEIKILPDYDGYRERRGGLFEFRIVSLHLCGNTGTCVEAPLHRHRDGADLAALPLVRLAHLPAKVTDAAGAGLAIGEDLLAGCDLAGGAVLFRTGWSRRWGTEGSFERGPHLAAAACEALLRAGAVFAGIDSLNIDDIKDLSRPAHTLLPGAGVPVREHTNLGAVPGSGGRLRAVPLAVRGGARMPVRAYVPA